jgi:hypothetical protein
MAQLPSHPMKRFLFAVVMSGITTFVVTIVLVLVNIGWNSQFMQVWPRTWAIAFVMVGLSIYFFSPVVRRWIFGKE